MSQLLRLLLLVLTIHLSISVFAAEKAPWTHESELALVKVNGNTESESYNGKQKTIYTFDLNALTVAGRYLESKAGSTQTAKSWDASIRYERILSDLWSTFIQQTAESDYFSGYTQRDSSDIGGKYIFIKSDVINLFSEVGYRQTKTLSSIGATTKNESFGRLYTEYTNKINESVTGKVWVEYLPNFTNSDSYLLNYEPSISVMMNSILSLKVSYLVKYHNTTLLATEKKEDTTFTTALVAKF